MNLRVFYLYQINDFCLDLYQQYPYRLYRILKDTYYTSKYHQQYAISSYEQVTNKFNRQFLHDFVKWHYKLDLYYHYKNSTHTISSNREYSNLLVSSYSLKIKSNLSYPSFFDSINDYNDSIFVCDFDNQDYFWLSKVIHKGKNVVKE